MEANVTVGKRSRDKFVLELIDLSDSAIKLKGSMGKCSLSYAICSLGSIDDRLNINGFSSTPMSKVR